MEGDGGHEDLPDTGADTSEAESVAETDPGEAEVEPEVTVRRHNYNLRPKRRAPVLDGDDVQAKAIEIAPGVGVVADQNTVGGRDTSKPTAKRTNDGDAAGRTRENSRVDSSPVETEARTIRDSPPQVVDRSGGVAWNIPVLRAKGRPRRPDERTEQRWPATRRRDAASGDSATARARPVDSSPRSGDEPTREEWDAFRRARLAERLRGTPLSDAFLPPNELARPGDSSRPSDAGRKAKSRREPSASNLLERTAPAKPGRGLLSDRCAGEGKWTLRVGRRIRSMSLAMRERRDIGR